MKKIWVSLLLLSSLLLIVGCTKSSGINFKTESHKDIMKLIILMPPEEKTNFHWSSRRSIDPFMSSQLSVITGPFGLLYSHASVMESFNNNDLYNERAASLNFNAVKYFIKKLALYLRQEGYSVEIFPKNTHNFMKEYSDRKVYLDFSGLRTVGYGAKNDSTLKPSVYLHVKLVKNQQVIYDKFFGTGYVKLAHYEIVDLGTKEEECYKDFDSLIANTDQSIERLKKVIDRIAKHIAVTLRRR